MKVLTKLLLIVIILTLTKICFCENNAKEQEVMESVVVENDILFCIAYTAVIAAQESGSIEVEIKTAVILVGIPAKTYEDLCQTGVGFCQIDLLSFG